MINKNMINHKTKYINSVLNQSINTKTNTKKITNKNRINLLKKLHKNTIISGGMSEVDKFINYIKNKDKIPISPHASLGGPYFVANMIAKFFAKITNKEIDTWVSQRRSINKNIRDTCIPHKNQDVTRDKCAQKITNKWESILRNMVGQKIKSVDQDWIIFDSFLKKQNDYFDTHVKTQKQLTKLTANTQELETLQKELQSKSDEVSKLNELQLQSVKDIDTLKIDIDTKKTKIDTINAEIIQMQQKHEIELSQKQTEYEDIISELKKTHSTQISSMTDDTSQQQQKYQNEINLKQKDHENAIKQLNETHKKKTNDMKDKIMQLNENLQELTYNLKENEETIEKNEVTIELLKEEVAAKEKIITQKEEEIKNITEYIETLNSHFVDLDKLLSISDNILATLDTEFDDDSKTLNALIRQYLDEFEKIKAFIGEEHILIETMSTQNNTLGQYIRQLIEAHNKFKELVAQLYTQIDIYRNVNTENVKIINTLKEYLSDLTKYLTKIDDDFKQKTLLIEEFNKKLETLQFEDNDKFKQIPELMQSIVDNNTNIPNIVSVTGGSTDVDDLKDQLPINLEDRLNDFKTKLEKIKYKILDIIGKNIDKIMESFKNNDGNIEEKRESLNKNKILVERFEDVLKKTQKEVVKVEKEAITSTEEYKLKPPAAPAEPPVVYNQQITDSLKRTKFKFNEDFENMLKNALKKIKVMKENYKAQTENLVEVGKTALITVKDKYDDVISQLKQEFDSKMKNKNKEYTTKMEIKAKKHSDEILKIESNAKQEIEEANAAEKTKAAAEKAAAEEAAAKAEVERQKTFDGEIQLRDLQLSECNKLKRKLLIGDPTKYIDQVKKNITNRKNKRDGNDYFFEKTFKIGDDEKSEKTIDVEINTAIDKLNTSILEHQNIDDNDPNKEKTAMDINSNFTNLQELAQQKDKIIQKILEEKTNTAEEKRNTAEENIKKMEMESDKTQKEAALKAEEEAKRKAEEEEQAARKADEEARLKAEERELIRKAEKEEAQRKQQEENEQREATDNNIEKLKKQVSEQKEKYKKLEEKYYVLGERLKIYVEETENLKKQAAEITEVGAGAGAGAEAGLVVGVVGGTAEDAADKPAEEDAAEEDAAEEDAEAAAAEQARLVAEQEETKAKAEQEQEQEQEDRELENHKEIISKNISVLKDNLATISKKLKSDSEKIKKTNIDNKDHLGEIENYKSELEELRKKILTLTLTSKLQETPPIVEPKHDDIEEQLKLQAEIDTANKESLEAQKKEATLKEEQDRISIEKKQQELQKKLDKETKEEEDNLKKQSCDDSTTRLNDENKELKEKIFDLKQELAMIQLEVGKYTQDIKIYHKELKQKEYNNSLLEKLIDESKEQNNKALELAQTKTIELENEKSKIMELVQENLISIKDMYEDKEKAEEALRKSLAGINNKMIEKEEISDGSLESIVEALNVSSDLSKKEFDKLDSKYKILNKELNDKQKSLAHHKKLLIESRYNTMRNTSNPKELLILYLNRLKDIKISTEKRFLTPEQIDEIDKLIKEYLERHLFILPPNIQVDSRGNKYALLEEFYKIVESLDEDKASQMVVEFQTYGLFDVIYDIISRVNDNIKKYKQENLEQELQTSEEERTVESEELKQQKQEDFNKFIEYMQGDFNKMSEHDNPIELLRYIQNDIKLKRAYQEFQKEQEEQRKLEKDMENEIQEQTRNTIESRNKAIEEKAKQMVKTSEDKYKTLEEEFESEMKIKNQEIEKDKQMIEQLLKEQLELNQYIVQLKGQFEREKTIEEIESESSSVSAEQAISTWVARYIEYIRAQEIAIKSKLEELNTNVLSEAKKYDDLIKNIIRVLKKEQHTTSFIIEKFTISESQREKLKSKLNRMFKKAIKYYTKKKVLK